MNNIEILLSVLPFGYENAITFDCARDKANRRGLNDHQFSNALYGAIRAECRDLYPNRNGDLLWKDKIRRPSIACSFHIPFGEDNAKSVKDIAIDNGVPITTVRSTINSLFTKGKISRKNGEKAFLYWVHEPEKIAPKEINIYALNVISCLESAKRFIEGCDKDNLDTVKSDSDVRELISLINNLIK